LADETGLRIAVSRLRPRTSKRNKIEQRLFFFIGEGCSVEIDAERASSGM
jgi:hypothetical protein